MSLDMKLRIWRILYKFSEAIVHVSLICCSNDKFRSMRTPRYLTVDEAVTISPHRIFDEIFSELISMLYLHPVIHRNKTWLQFPNGLSTIGWYAGIKWTIQWMVVCAAHEGNVKFRNVIAKCAGIYCVQNRTTNGTENGVTPARSMNRLKETSIEWYVLFVTFI